MLGSRGKWIRYFRVFESFVDARMWCKEFRISRFSGMVRVRGQVWCVEDAGGVFWYFSRLS